LAFLVFSLRLPFRGPLSPFAGHKYFFFPPAALLGVQGAERPRVVTPPLYPIDLRPQLAFSRLPCQRMPQQIAASPLLMRPKPPSFSPPLPPIGLHRTPHRIFVAPFLAFLILVLARKLLPYELKRSASPSVPPFPPRFLLTHLIFNRIP